MAAATRRGPARESNHGFELRKDSRFETGTRRTCEVRGPFAPRPSRGPPTHRDRGEPKPGTGEGCGVGRNEEHGQSTGANDHGCRRSVCGVGRGSRAGRRRSRVGARGDAARGAPCRLYAACLPGQRVGFQTPLPRAFSARRTHRRRAKTRFGTRARRRRRPCALSPGHPRRARRGGAEPTRGPRRSAHRIRQCFHSRPLPGRIGVAGRARRARRLARSGSADSLARTAAERVLGRSLS